VLDDGGGFGGGGFCGHTIGEDRGDTLVVEAADLDGPGGDRFGAGVLDVAKQAHHAQTGPEALLGVRASGEDGDDQTLGLRANRGGPSPKPIRRPVRVAAMGTGHVIRVRAVASSAISTLMGSDPLAPMEDLDRAGGRPQIDLLPDEAVWHRVEEALELDVVIRGDAHQTPFGEFVVVAREAREGGGFDGLEEMAAAHAQTAHDVIVDPIDGTGNGSVGLRQREEGLMAQPTEDASLREADAVLDLCLT